MISAMKLFLVATINFTFKDIFVLISLLSRHLLTISETMSIFKMLKFQTSFYLPKPEVTAPVVNM